MMCCVTGQGYEPALGDWLLNVDCGARLSEVVSQCYSFHSGIWASPEASRVPAVPSSVITAISAPLMRCSEHTSLC